MISLTCYDATFAACRASDSLAVQVCAVSEFYRWRTLTTGDLEQWRVLTKALPGLPVGTVVRLRDLHERLLMEAAKT